ncbi:MAG: fibronectin type III domain-containing protein [Colwellia sp.]|uniref:M12 family metallopeptidase n=1 Tax=Colwellia sp. TaxID=56799 RepID=UPI0025BC4106|nr:M12 family metallopeptidase [Colwellia sp.]NQZ27168.1 fibronectin type III domain-containing protein [Colwellia sp.]
MNKSSLLTKGIKSGLSAGVSAGISAGIVAATLLTSSMAFAADSSRTDKDNLMGFSSEGRELVTIKTNDGNEITAVDIDGQAFVGDILLGNTQELLKHGLIVVDNSQQVYQSDVNANAAIIYPNSGAVWPNGVVPYVMSSSLSSSARNALYYAIDHWNNSGTGIQLVARTNEGSYINMINAGGCYSMIGRQGGVQNLGLAANCGNGAAVHEIGHAVGFYHEQSRNDRDNYLTINWSNISSSMQYNFQKMGSGGMDHGSYDYYSIMHYFSTAFSINGYPTMVPTDSSINLSVMGFAQVLSNKDLSAASYLYGGGVNPSLPATPSNLVASAVTNSAFNLTWSAVSGASQYDVERWLDNTGWVSAGTSTSNTINISGLSNTDQWVHVKAKNNAGSSDYSDYIHVQLADVAQCDGIATPAEPVTSNISSDGFTLTWSATTGADYYQVQIWNQDTSAWKTVANVNGTSHDITGLTGTTAYARVVAHNNCDDEPQASSWLTITLAATSCTAAPTTPTGLTYSNSTYYQFDASWNQVAGATSYDVQLWNGQWVDTASSANTSVSVDKLYPGGSNYLQVSASNACGSSSYSNYIAVN